MKLKRKLFLTIFLTGLLFLGGSQICPAQSLPAAGLPYSMKGYELYSWKARGNWYFSLLPGTNRQKTLAEVGSPRNRLKGVDALRKKLGLLPEGEEVLWGTHRIPKMSMPPKNIVDSLIDYCKRRGVILTVGPYTDSAGRDWTVSTIYCSLNAKGLK